MSEDARWRAVFADQDRRGRWLDYARAWNERINAFVSFADAPGGAGAASGVDADDGADADGRAGGPPAEPLAGVPCAVKDNIAVAGQPLSCGSALLGAHVAPFSATCVRRLQDAGAIVAGKTNLDEFGMGSDTQASVHGGCGNPWDPELVPGGSSGGSAAAVAAGIVPFALGSDTGGSVRQPAAFCGVFGLKPTYGVVSRFGLVSYASSLEVIGVIADSPQRCGQVLEVIAGLDDRDQSTVAGTPDRDAVRTIGVPRACRRELRDPQVRAALDAAAGQLSALGYRMVDVDLATLRYAAAAYYVISCAEASANLARFDGVRYGARAAGESADQTIIASRSAGFGDEVKLRVLAGTYVLRSGFHDRYYLRAQRVRTALRDELTALFEQVDLLLMPVYPAPPFARGSARLDPFEQKVADRYTTVANLAGAPALSFPTPQPRVPIGMQLIGPNFGERLILDVAARYAAEHPPARPPGYAEDWR